MSKPLDILIVTVPIVYPMSPPIGPAIINAVVHNAGYSGKVLDLNIELYKEKNLHDLFYKENESFSFYPGVRENRESFINTYEKYLKGFCEKWARKIINYNSKVVGLSLFSHQSFFMAQKLAEEIYKLKADARVVIGGPYALSIIKDQYTRDLLPESVDVIAGEGEVSIIKYLEGELSYPGINSMPKQIEDLSLVPTPRYEKEQFLVYDEIDGVKRTYITASRGCVRRCTFCDVKSLWPIYRYRAAQSIYNEMVFLHEQYGREEFKFTDSLINGNVRVLRELSDLIVAGNHKFQWGGQFICRRKEVLTEDFFDALSESGCQYLSVGIESGSEKVRKDMRKVFSNEDMYYTFEQLNRVKIKVCILMLLGYITETEDEFQKTLNFFEHCMKSGFFQSDDGSQEGCIERINLGMTLAVSLDTEAHDLLMNLNPESPHGFHWECNGIDRFVRLERLFRAAEFLSKRGFSNLIASQTGAIYGVLWEEFKEHGKFDNVDVNFVEQLKSQFLNS